LGWKKGPRYVGGVSGVRSKHKGLGKKKPEPTPFTTERKNPGEKKKGYGGRKDDATRKKTLDAITKRWPRARFMDGKKKKRGNDAGMGGVGQKRIIGKTKGSQPKKRVRWSAQGGKEDRGEKRKRLR